MSSSYMSVNIRTAPGAFKYMTAISSLGYYPRHFSVIYLRAHGAVSVDMAVNLSQIRALSDHCIYHRMSSYFCSLPFNIDHYDSPTLYRLNVDVLHSCRKLSLIEENKDAMRLLNLAQKCTKFLPCSSSSVTILILRLLFNLSFDMEFRSSMIKNGSVSSDSIVNSNYITRATAVLEH
jgi:hypothetical protein